MNAISDMTEYTEAASAQLTADDLIGGPRTVTITGVVGAVEEGKKRAIISFEGDGGKPFKPCKTMARMIVAVWGKYPRDYIGRSLTLYRDEEVTFGAMATGGVRISHMSHMESETAVVLAAKKGKKATYRVRPLATQQRQAPAPEQHDAQTSELPAPPVDEAKAWTKAMLVKIAATTDRASLAALQQGNAEQLASLSTERPGLSDKLQAAILARFDALEPALVAVDLDDDLDA